MTYSSTHAKDAISASRDYLARHADGRPMFDDDPAELATASAYKLGVFIQTTKYLADHLEAAVARIAELESAADQREVA